MQGVLPVPDGLLPDYLYEPLEILDYQRRGGPEEQVLSGVDHIGAREPEVDEAGVGTEVLCQGPGESHHIVARLGLNLSDPHREGLVERHLFDRRSEPGRGASRYLAEPLPGLGGGQFYLEPGPVAVGSAPQSGHLGRGVAVDHGGRYHGTRHNSGQGPLLD